MSSISPDSAATITDEGSGHRLFSMILHRLHRSSPQPARHPAPPPASLPLHSPEQTPACSPQSSHRIYQESPTHTTSQRAPYHPPVRGPRTCDISGQSETSGDTPTPKQSYGLYAVVPSLTPLDSVAPQTREDYVESVTFADNRDRNYNPIPRLPQSRIAEATARRSPRPISAPARRDISGQSETSTPPPRPVLRPDTRPATPDSDGLDPLDEREISVESVTCADKRDRNPNQVRRLGQSRIPRATVPRHPRPVLLPAWRDITGQSETSTPPPRRVLRPDTRLDTFDPNTPERSRPPSPHRRTPAPKHERAQPRRLRYGAASPRSKAPSWAGQSRRAAREEASGNVLSSLWDSGDGASRPDSQR